MNIVLIGGGAMGRALYDGWISAGISEKSIALQDIDPDRCLGDAEALLNDDAEKTVVLAVKPQHIASVLSGCSKCMRSGDILASVAAGVSLKVLRDIVRNKIEIVRVMPNLPVALNAGTIGITKDGLEVTTISKLEAKWNQLGQSFLISEHQMDAFTAVAGSGPAYFFQFAEFLASHCAQLGLDEEIAEPLISQVMLGAAKMLSHPDGQDAAGLRNRVTSPGGTTEAGLQALNQGGKLEELVLHCFESAAARGSEIASQAFRD